VSAQTQRVLLVGVGGQGVLTSGNSLGDAALAAGIPIMVGQLHGMSQRGGAVECSLVFGPARTAFINRAAADLVVAFEPLEALRVLPRIKPGATVVLNREPIVPFSMSRDGGTYPSIESIEAKLRETAQQVIVVDAATLGREAGNARTASVAMLGILSGLGVVPVDEATLLRAIERRCPERVLAVNRRAFALGVRSAAGDTDAPARVGNG
jgi:indolepyruvate ferredoxin oxidoreductase beta subunit